MKVKIYTTETCYYCKLTKEYLKRKKIEFEEIVIKDEKTANEAFELSGQYAVPITVIGNEIIVGYNVPKLEKAIHSHTG